MSSLYPILTKDTMYICCQRLVKESILKFNQFGAFGAFKCSHVRVMPDQIASFWENLGPFLLTRNFMVTFCFHQFFLQSSLLGFFDFKKAVAKDSCSLQFSGILGGFLFLQSSWREMSLHRVSKGKPWYDTCYQILLVTRTCQVVPLRFGSRMPI